jgi:phosphatidate cytidylyltransferase
VQSATEENSKPDANAPEKAERQWLASLGLRGLTAIVLVPVILLFVWFGGWWTFAGVLIIVLVSTGELYSMMLNSGYRPVIVLSLALSVLFLVAAMLPQQRLILLEIGLGAAVLVSLPWLFFRKKLDGALVDWALTLSFAIYLGWPMSFFPLLRGNEAVRIPGSGGALIFLPRGLWWSLVLFLGVWAFDTAAFFVGHYFGRHKLAPSISPGKTWEGTVGGLVISVVVVVALAVYALGVPWYLAIVLGILIDIAAVFGDLAESLIKRQTHVKDSGQIVPGHGGILDRADSLIFAVIIVYVFVQLIGG